MADVPNVTQPSDNWPKLATPIIVVIAIGAYLVLLLILVVIRQFLVTRGVCVECAPCGKEDGRLSCCDCWIALAESCNCCAYPNMRSCLDSLCGPPDNRCSLEKCLQCQTCQGENACGEAGGCECAGCDCACTNPECENIDCFCFKIQLKN